MELGTIDERQHAAFAFLGVGHLTQSDVFCNSIQVFEIFIISLFLIDE